MTEPAVSNACGVGRSNRSKTPDMTAFDQLPSKVRQALADASFNWSAAWALRNVKREGSGMTLKRVREAEQQLLRKSRQAMDQR
jgi:hypothetical protein